MPHAFMIGLGKQKGDANLLQQIGCFLWRKGDVDMQCLQGIRTSAFTRYAAVSMLGNCQSCTAQYKGGGGGNIKGIQTVTTGADDIDNTFHIGWKRCRLAYHDPGRCCDFRRTFLFHLHCDQKCADLFTACSAIHNDIHGSFHFLCCQIMVFTDLFNIFL